MSKEKFEKKPEGDIAKSEEIAPVMELAKTERRQTILEKSAWNKNFVKLEKNGQSKLQDNPDRIRQLEAEGWKRA